MKQGFETVMDYYRSASVVGNIDKFTIPVFGLSAEDDPMQPLSCEFLQVYVLF